MSIVSKWSVAQEHPVEPDDLGPDGAVTDAAIERWAADATAAYLEQCPRLEDRRVAGGLVLHARVRAHSGGAQLTDSPTVAVTATATEVLPEAFVISVRLRPVGGESDDPLDLSCEVWLEDPGSGAAQEIGDEIRDELIALEHAARHYN